LVKRIALDKHKFTRSYKESILYANNNGINGVILSLDGIKGNLIKRNDYYIYLIGDKEFKKRIKEVLRNR